MSLLYDKSKIRLPTPKLLINNEWVESNTGMTFHAYDPYTEKTIGTVQRASKADVDLAVKSAKKAFEAGPWSAMSANDRGTLLLKLANLIDQGIVIRRKQTSDRRASLLLISPGTLKLLSKYCSGLSTISASHFK